jgi:AraC-like DNA-binding protein
LLISTVFYKYRSFFFELKKVLITSFISITNAKFVWKKADWWHFVPFLLLTLKPLAIFGHDIIWEHWIQGKALVYFDGTRGNWADYLNNNEVTLFQALSIFERVYLMGYLILTVVRFNQYKKYLRSHFSNEDRYALNWMRILLFVFIIGFGMSWLGNVLSWVIDLDYADTWYSHFVMSLTIYILSIRLYALGPERMRSLQFEPSPVAEAIAPKEELIQPEQQQPEEEVLSLSPILDKLMEEQQPFLDADLNLAALSTQLDVSPALLSKTINLIHKQNFNDYVNGYRSREVMRRLEAGEHEKLTFLSIALDAGFNSKATFNRAFKKYTGESRRQYVSNHEMRRLTS